MNVSLEKLITTALLVPMGDPNKPNCIWGLPLLLWGPPGIGKSDRIKAAGAAALLTVKPVFAATRAPEDFAGVPILKDGNISVECILGAVRDLCAVGRGVLFLDEISCAVPAVQAALLSVVLDRVVGDTVIPPEVRIMAAANPPEEAAGGWELELPMANRFAHINVYAPSTSDWLNWLLKEKKEEIEEAELLQEQIVANWESAYSRACGLAAGFFAHFPGGEELHKVPKMGDKARGRAWPSPRTWEMAIRSIATCFALGLSQDLMEHFMAACIGEPVAVMWGEWVAKANLPTPLEVVTNIWTPDAKRLDRTVAVLTAMSGFVVNEPDKIKQERYAIGAWKVIEKARKLEMLDLVVVPARKLHAAKLSTNATSKEVKEAARPSMYEIGITEIAEIVK